MGLIQVYNPIGRVKSDEGGGEVNGKRLETLSGKAIGFIDDMKPNAGLFLKCIEALLTAEFQGLSPSTVRKNLTANMAIAHELDETVQGVVVAWGD